MKKKALLILFAMITLSGVKAISSEKEPKTPDPETRLSLSGVVIDKNSNEKLAGVTIQLTSPDQKIYSDSKGEFTFDGITPGTYKVKINCISYKDKEVSVKITKTRNEKLKILVDPIKP